MTYDGNTIESMLYLSDKMCIRDSRDGIRNMIELCQDLGTTEDNAKSQIIMRFRIPEEEAVKYIKTFWKSEK